MIKQNDKIIKILKNPWTITVVGGVAVFLFTSALNSLIQKVNYIDGIKNVFILFFTILKSILTFKVPIWIILLVFMGLIFMIYILSVWKNNEPLWINYKSDYFFEWLFIWEYYNNFGTMEITGLRPVCSNCRCELSRGSDKEYLNYEETLYCPDCGKKFNLLAENTIDDVKKIIINKMILLQKPPKNPHFRRDFIS